MGPGFKCDPTAGHRAEELLQPFRSRADWLLSLYVPRFIHHTVPAVAISKIQPDRHSLLRNIPALLCRCGANLFRCRSPSSLVPL